MIRPSLLALAAVLAASGISSAQERIEKGNLILENVPETPAEVAASLRQYQNARSAGFGGFDADGEGIFISTRFGNVTQVHMVEEPMGARRQVTFFDEPVGANPSPADAGRFLFSRDQGGDEDFQVYLFDTATGQSQLLSDGEGRKTGARWSPDGKRVAWTKTMAGATKGIVVADIDNPDGRETVFTADGWWGAMDFSDDGSQLLLINYISINESEIHHVDLTSGESQRIDEGEGRISYGAAMFAADGEHIYLTSDEGDEFRNLYRFNIGSGEKENLTADINADVAGLSHSDDGRYYAFTTNDEGRSRLYVRQARNDRDVRVPTIPAGVISSLQFSPTDNIIGFSLNAATSPGDVYSFRVGRDRELTRWTESEVGGLDTSAFIAPEFFRYPTFDDRQIPAFMYRPEGEGPFPVIISIHGGPESQARPFFSSTFQYWANELGAAVLVPNVRGSSGFGKTYVSLDNGMKRKDSVKDIGALLDWIDGREDLDSDKVVVYGGSYGGYMVLASMVDYDDRLAGGVDIVGISSFVTFLENTADYRRDLRRAEYGDERDPEMRAFFDEIDPLNNADQITKPLFIIQGLNDPRVPASEADQILAAVRANGGTAWYMGARDEGHGFRKKNNRDAMTEAVVMFLEGVFEGDLSE